VNNERLTSSQNTPVLSTRIENPELITASHLAQWPEIDSQDSRPRFPELMRRLLVETPQASEISIRTGDGTSLAGPDGVAIFKEPTKLLPSGRLLFEFGTNKKIKDKADTDYDKSKEKALPNETFVFVTPRRWQGKHDWVAEHQADGLFKDVRVLDADDLELWLQLAPNTHIWISERLGLHPRDAITLDKWWNDFRRSTSPELPLELFTAGRGKEAEQLRQLVKGEPQSIQIKSEWEDDVLGFIAAALNQQTEADSNDTPPIIVRSAEVWERVTAQPGNGTLIPLFDRPDIDRAIHSGRHVVEVLDNNTAQPSNNVNIELPRLDLDEAEKAFWSKKVGSNRAYYLARIARLSIPALVREISCAGRIQKPDWSEDSSANILSALMLVGSWNENDNYKDLQAISELSGISLEKLKDFIFNTVNKSDPALRRTGEIVLFTSPKQAFSELGKNGISSTTASRWSEIASHVILESNSNSYKPTSIEENITAPTGKEHFYSFALRRGIADSLALAGSMKTENISQISKEIVKDILQKIISHEDLHTWSDIADIFPLIAETAPDDFLDALEEDLKFENPSISKLLWFPREEVILYRYSLMSALRLLCWWPEYFIRTSEILTKLHQYPDPRLEFSLHTPPSIMSSIYTNRLLKDCVDIKTQLTAIEKCRSIDRSAIWSLLRSIWVGYIEDLAPSPFLPDMPLLPDMPRYNLEYILEHINNTSKPSENTSEEFVLKTIKKAIEWTKSDNTELPYLVCALDVLTVIKSEYFYKIIDLVKRKINNDELGLDIHLRILRNLEELVLNIDLYLSSEKKDDLKDLFTSIRAAIDSQLPKILDDSDSWNQLEKIIRAEAEAVYEFDSILQRTIRPIIEKLDSYNHPNTVDIILRLLDSDDIDVKEKAKKWVNDHAKRKGPELLKRVLKREDISEEVRSLFIASIPTESRFWNLLREYPDDEKIFWKKAEFISVPEKDIVDAIEMLLHFDLPGQAINAAGRAIGMAPHHQVSISSRTQEDNSLVLDPKLLTSVLWAADEELKTCPGYFPFCIENLEIIFDYLVDNKLSTADLVSLEFSYFIFLDGMSKSYALKYAIGSDPDLFLSLACGKISSEQSIYPLIDFNNQSLAKMVLSKWDGFPGQQNDGTLNEELMHSWVKHVRSKLSSSDFTSDLVPDVVKSCYVFWGQALGRIPMNAESTWLCESVRDIIEDIDSDNLNEGVYQGVLQSISPSIPQYDELAKKYFTLSSSAGLGPWPSSSKIAKRIAKHYQSEYQKEQIHQDLS